MERGDYNNLFERYTIQPSVGDRVICTNGHRGTVTRKYYEPWGAPRYTVKTDDGKGILGGLKYYELALARK